MVRSRSIFLVSIQLYHTFCELYSVRTFFEMRFGLYSIGGFIDMPTRVRYQRENELGNMDLASCGTRKLDIYECSIEGTVMSNHNIYRQLGYSNNVL